MHSWGALCAVKDWFCQLLISHTCNKSDASWESVQYSTYYSSRVWISHVVLVGLSGVKVGQCGLHSQSEWEALLLNPTCYLILEQWTTAALWRSHHGHFRHSSDFNTAAIVTWQLIATSRQCSKTAADALGGPAKHTWGTQFRAPEYVAAFKSALELLKVTNQMLKLNFWACVIIETCMQYDTKNKFDNATQLRMCVLWLR